MKMGDERRKEEKVHHLSTSINNQSLFNLNAWFAKRCKVRLVKLIIKQKGF
jgi:hypothetical protein